MAGRDPGLLAGARTRPPRKTAVDWDEEMLALLRRLV